MHRTCPCEGSYYFSRETIIWTVSYLSNFIKNLNLIEIFFNNIAAFYYEALNTVLTLKQTNNKYYCLMISINRPFLFTGWNKGFRRSHRPKYSRR
jgi:hypothetical protein